MFNSNIIAWKKGQSFLGCCFLRYQQFIYNYAYTSLTSLSAITFLHANFVSWCVENSTLRKYDNMTHFKQEIFFNVKIFSYKNWSML